MPVAAITTPHPTAVPTSMPAPGSPPTPAAPRDHRDHDSHRPDSDAERDEPFHAGHRVQPAHGNRGQPLGQRTSSTSAVERTAASAPLRRRRPSRPITARWHRRLLSVDGDAWHIQPTRPGQRGDAPCRAGDENKVPQIVRDGAAPDRPRRRGGYQVPPAGLEIEEVHSVSTAVMSVTDARAGHRITALESCHIAGPLLRRCSRSTMTGCDQGASMSTRLKMSPIPPLEHLTARRPKPFSRWVGDPGGVETAAGSTAPERHRWRSAREPRVLHARGTSNACDGADG